MDTIMKKQTFADFAQKAKKRIDERKKYRTEQIFVKDMDETITIHALTEEEFNEVQEYSDVGTEADDYMIYLSSDTLQMAASALVNTGELTKHIDIMEMFSRAEKTKIALKILEISGMSGETENLEFLSEKEEAKNF